jgi:hypothetical protein
LDRALGGISSLHRILPELVTSIQQGKAAQAIDAVPAPLRGRFIAAVHSSFAGGLNLCSWSAALWPSSAQSAHLPSFAHATSWPRTAPHPRPRPECWTQPTDGSVTPTGEWARLRLPDGSLLK